VRAGILRSSFSNWQPGYATGVVAAQKGYKRAMTITWNYAAGTETVKGFTEAFEKGGGKVVKDLSLPFPNVEFQALLTEIAAQKPDVVFAFFAGGGAVKFVKDYDAAGLRKSVAADGLGLPDRRHAGGAGRGGAGLLTALHYADGIDTPRNNAFRNKYAVTYKVQPDVYAVQGYDAAATLAAGLTAVKGDFGKRDAMVAAMRKAQIDSPRGKYTLSPAAQPGAGLLHPRGQGPRTT
jgi:branched-chain amino acid transport system substrate-binding protein